MEPPKTLTVVFADTLRTETAIIHEGQSFPYRFRTVQIELTKEQRESLSPKLLGVSGKMNVYEELFNSWIEPMPGEG